jgi:hypothetical protein
MLDFHCNVGKNFFRNSKSKATLCQIMTVFGQKKGESCDKRSSHSGAFSSFSTESHVINHTTLLNSFTSFLG